MTSTDIILFSVECALNGIESRATCRLRMAQDKVDVLQLVAPSSSATVHGLFAGAVSPVKLMAGSKVGMMALSLAQHA